MSVKYGSGKGKFVGQSIVYSIPIPLDATQHFGAVVVANDGQLYYSNGFDWIIPTEDVEISRPSARVPTNATEQTQLRISEFRSPAGLTQTGILFEISTNGVNFTGAETRTVTSTFATMYQLLYPEDGFAPGDEILWRARYLGTDGAQSDFSIPYVQVFPDLITTPVPLTRENAVSGTFTMSPFESAPVFGLGYYQTEVEFYAAGSTPGVSTPITTVIQVTGNVTTAPIPPLVAGLSYIARGRYSARVNPSAPAVFSQWSESRTFFMGAASIVLEYDMDFVVSRTIQIPLGTAAPAGEPYSVTVDWGDGTSQVFTTGGTKSKTYAVGFTPTNGRFTVIISGRMTSYGNFSMTNQPGLVRVENIGFTMGLTSLASMLYLTTINLEYVTPNLPETVTDLSSFMQSSTANPASLSTLDTRNVTNMRQMFQQASVFNRDISSWDVSRVTNMSSMFNGAAAFNQAIATWNVANVTVMNSTFLNAAAFNQNIGAWNVGNVTDMTNMFRGSTGFNNGGSPSINDWNTLNVVNMTSMFEECQFNQPIGAWNVSKVTNMTRMFLANRAFNQNIGLWDVSSVILMPNLFHVAIAFNNGGSPSIDNWDVSSVTNMSLMFSNSGNPGVHQFNQPIGSWNVSNVTTMSSMFNNSPSFNQDISAWNVSNVVSMDSMFANAVAFNQPIGSWNVGNVVNMTGMFSVANSFNQDISAWDMSKVGNMTNMFLSTAAFNQPIGEWNVSSVTTMANAFTNANALNQNLGGFDLRKAGVVLSPLGINAMNQENYSRTLIGWANYVATTDGPHDVTLGVQATRQYNANNYVTGARFTNAVAARAFLVGGRAVSVTGSSDTNANTTYTYNGTTQTYDAANGWKFAVLGTSWALYDASAVLQATGTGTAVGTGPHTATSWTGVLSAATILRTGAGWTITGDAAA